MNWLFGGLAGASVAIIVIVIVMMFNKWQENWIIIPGLVWVVISALVGCVLGGASGAWVLGFVAAPIILLAAAVRPMVTWWYRSRY